jgi:PAS domain S-box-containing protein
VVINVRMLKTIKKIKTDQFFWESPNPMCITKAIDGTFVEVNEAFMKYLGLEREEIVGRKSVELGPITAESRLKIVNQIKEEGYAENVELEAIAGKHTKILFNTFPIKMGKDDLWLTIATEIPKIRLAVEMPADILFKSLNSVKDTGVILISGNNTQQPDLFYINEKAKRALNGQPITDLLGALERNESIFVGNKTECYHVKTISTDHASLLKIILLERVPSIICIKEKLKRHDLTDRQKEIAFLTATGFSNREIAKNLCISEHTVKDHLKEIFRKIDIRKRSELCPKILDWR